MSDNFHTLDLPHIVLKGSAKQMGESFGEQFREKIRQLAEIRLRDAQHSCFQRTGKRLTEDKVFSIATECLSIAEKWDNRVQDEFLGIARGANLAPEKLFVMQGLTDMRDHMAGIAEADGEGCSSFILNGERTATGKLLIGQNWDLQTSNMDYVVLVERHTDDAPDTISLTLTGCLSLIGINSEGMAIGNTNLMASDTRPGIQYLQLIHRILRCRDIKEAMPILRNAPRLAAHYYYLGDAKGHSIGIECSAQNSALLHPENGFLIHCNHALADTICALETETVPGSSTTYRQRRLSALISGHSSKIEVENLKEILSDHQGGEDSICRHGQDISTNACVIMSPETMEIHACRGQAHIGEWLRVKI